MVQFFIVLTGAIQIWLLSEKSDIRKWGFIVMLFGQCFWTYETLVKELWGMFLLTMFYWYCAFKGIYLHWIKKDE